MTTTKQVLPSQPKKRVRINELKKLVEDANVKCYKKDHAFHGSDNPQVIEMRQQNQGRLEAYKAVLNALEGDFVFLRIDT